MAHLFKSGDWTRSLPPAATGRFCLAGQPLSPQSQPPHLLERSLGGGELTPREGRGPSALQDGGAESPPPPTSWPSGKGAMCSDKWRVNGAPGQGEALQPDAAGRPEQEGCSPRSRLGPPTPRQESGRPPRPVFLASKSRPGGSMGAHSGVPRPVAGLCRAVGRPGSEQLRNPPLKRNPAATRPGSPRPEPPQARCHASWGPGLQDHPPPLCKAESIVD